MMKAKDIMTADPITAAPGDDVVSTTRIMLDKRINGLPVVDEDGRLAGVICQSDLMTQQKSLRLPSLFTVLDGFIPLASMDKLEREIKKITAMTVADAMSVDVVSVAPEASLEEVATLMVDSKYHTLPVVDGETLVGVIGKEDVLRTLLAEADKS